VLEIVIVFSTHMLAIMMMMMTMTMTATATAFYDDDDNLVQKWLGRVVATIAIAVAWHWYQTPAKRPLRFDHGKRLTDETTAPNPTAATAAALRSRLLVDDLHSLPPVQVEEEDRPEPSAPFMKEESNDIVDEETVEESATESMAPTAAASATTTTTESVADADAPAAPKSKARRGIPAPAPAPSNPPIKATSSLHPGLAGFKHWYEVEASLYRIYTIGKKDAPEVAPEVTRSERGHVNLKLEIQNSTHRAIDVFWVDYKGKEVLRGKLQSTGFFHQTTWIGHPWTFRYQDTGELLLHFIPFRVIPTTEAVPTTNPDDPEVGIHAFTIQRPITDTDLCAIHDAVFPCNVRTTTTQSAVAWSFQHMTRLDYPYGETLTKYLTNIVRHPGEPKYRQIRTAGKVFSQQVWNTAARGLLLAAGFAEQGPFVELGSMDPLPRERVQELSTLLFYLEQWRRVRDQATPYVQPTGADGGGRANFGRAGQMNI
jgi:hypothetical protein